jgi:hypothetical protein
LIDWQDGLEGWDFGCRERAEDDLRSGARDPFRSRTSRLDTQGARQLSSVIASQPSNLLDNLGGMSDGPGQLVNIDNTALSTLFGNTTLGGLSGALWQICWHWRGRCSKPARYGGAYNPRRSPATNWWRH